MNTSSLAADSHVNAAESSGTSPTREQSLSKAATLLRMNAAEPAGVTATIASDLGDDDDRDEAAGIVAEALRVIAGGNKARDTHYTDIGNALRLVAEHGDKIRYQSERKIWLAWDGRRWETDVTGEVVRYAKETVHRMFIDGAKLADSDDRKKALAHAAKSEGAARIEAMIRMATTDERVVVRADDLDSDPWALNVRNGTLDLRTGKLRPHDPAELHTKLVAADYDPDAPAPQWEAFLAEVLPDDELRRFVQKLVGYSLAGDVGENILPFPYGDGANGKSVFLGVLGTVLGDYADEAAPDLLAQRKGDRGIPADIADLRGFRFVTTTEVEDGRKMDTQVMKRVTGDHNLKARGLYQNYATFPNVTTVWLAANARPKVDGLDEAVFRRIRMLPFTVTIPAARRDPELRDKLLAEHDGILRWAVEGLTAYHADKASTGAGLTPPEIVAAANDDYKAESNPLRDWADERVKLDPTAWTATSTLRSDYDEWCHYGRIREPIPRRSKRWTAGLVSLGCHEQRGSKPSKQRGWAGIRLSREDDLPL